MNSTANPETLFLKSMKTSSNFLGCLCISLVLGSPVIARAANAAKVFASPEAAVAALRTAAINADSNALWAIFGSEVEDLQNPDPVQAESDLKTFSAALSATNHLVRTSKTNVVLEVGEDSWPFPIPIVQNGTGWSFDTEAGKDELLSRRIGRNELSTLKVMRAYVDAQREYASRDRDGDEVLEYAQKIASSPGKMDGLYWPLELNGEMSPLGPLMAHAQGEGYFTEGAKVREGPQPFHGYYFKILTRQGKHAPGGKCDFIVNGNMVIGFAMVAWPVEYGESGIMTFIVNQQGRVYQKDLGHKTSSIASKMKEYDPDKTWIVSPD